MRTPEHQPFRSSMSSWKYMDIFRHAADSSYGRTLSQEIRFAPFKPASVSREAWVDALGNDVDNLRHMPLTFGLTRWFLALQKADGRLSHIRFSPHEETSMCLASTIHDFAEAIVGDESALTKTKRFEKREMILLRSVMMEMFGTEPDLAIRIQEAIGEVLEDTASGPGAAFKAIERIGYLRTASIAWRNADIQTDPLAGALRELARDVVSNTLPKLSAEWGRYPAVDGFLTLHAPTFEAIRALSAI